MTEQAFIPVTTHKRDEFSETISGHLEGEPDRRLVLRKLSGVPFWAKPIAGFLARREIRGLRAVAGIRGVPQLVRVDDAGILRTWSEGTPLNLSKPSQRAFYRDAARVLAQLRARGVTHNDLAKPQNWLMSPAGRAELIDFQLASVHRRKGRLYRLMAYEDLRHLLKQKKRYAPNLLTPREKAVLARRSLPSRLWMATAKRAYNFVTRRLLDWSDGEGTGHRMATDGQAIRAALKADPEVKAVALSTYSKAARGIGLYVFVETTRDPAALRRLVSERQAELVQAVPALPRGRGGAIREDLLTLVAGNRLDELEDVLAREPGMAAVMAPIIAGRLNLTDRRLAGI